jgi:osmotically-inducible protein OsmY
MSVVYPLAIVITACSTSLVRMTLYHHSTSVFHTEIEMNEGATALGGKAGSAPAENPVTRLGRNIAGVQAVENQMAVEQAKSKE